MTLGLALPAFSAAIERQRVVAVHNDLMAALHYARTQAVVLRRHTVVCPTSDGAQCLAGGVWDQGWMVFIDEDRDGGLDANERLLRVDQRDAGMRIRTSPSRPRISFRPNGMSGGSNLTLRICDAAQQVIGGLVLANTGRARRLPPGGACA